MTDEKSPARAAADQLFDQLSETSEDYLEEAYAATWPGGEDEWIEHDLDNAAAREVHSEATFSAVMAELAAICLERSLGRVNGESLGDSA